MLFSCSRLLVSLLLESRNSVLLTCRFTISNLTTLSYGMVKSSSPNHEFLVSSSGLKMKLSGMILNPNAVGSILPFGFFGNPPRYTT